MISETPHLMEVARI